MREHRPTNSSASYSYFGKDADKYLTGRCVCYVAIVVVGTGTGAGLGSLVGDFIGGLREILIGLGIGSAVGFGLSSAGAALWKSRCENGASQEDSLETPTAATPLL
ncbi:hypothetical protein [Coxiella burnetii]|uniref:Uncharacterized protein n=1 Tax=Coxiella burnetii (strain Dugway 5J108-111) TaxID=434922 RepID=B5XHF8_COXBN|nr:hypothetical protein [Coxiella burnetii]ACI23178.1 hypothetical protein CBUD_1479a [Coxiella burnetii Dugway 5J108-111]ACJ18716.1 hypothetical protein CbuG_1414 [Coxiella burnetii CbuG_Q212]ATN67095.1 hypothetical protein AYM17_06930 [Coxiella burnetii]ATN86070.1 hypothetical protein AYO29_06280 [Coxiella burnetii str. Schperling]OYK79785.1 hypothetical protein CbuD7E6568_07615 [Coxiella burnetii]